MRTRVKFCGLVREQDVRLAASLGVDALGLVFYAKSPRFVEPDLALQLRRAMPSFVAAVGLFVNAPPALVQECQRRLGLDVIQFHGDETPAQVHQSLAGPEGSRLAPGPAYWRAIRVQPETDLLESDRMFSDAEALLLDAFSTGYGGSGKRFDWRLAQPLSPGRMILSGGLDEHSVGEGIAQLSPLAVDVSSGIQTADPRVKSAELMERFMQAVRTADLLKERR